MKISDLNEAFDKPYEFSSIDRADRCTRYLFSDKHGSDYAVLFLDDQSESHYPIDVSFGTLRGDNTRPYNFDLRRSNRSQLGVYATVIKAVDDYIAKNSPTALEFSAWENATIPLYKKYATHLATKYDMELIDGDGIFTLRKKTDDLNEAFDKPYTITTAPRVSGSSVFEFTTDDGDHYKIYFHDEFKSLLGHYIDISFAKFDYDEELEPDEPKSNIFALTRSKKNRMRVYSTMLNAINSYIETSDPSRLQFSAWDEDTIPLYTKFANFLVQKYGYELEQTSANDRWYLSK